jgi:peptidoglycan/LPS O-acetylase OafA/YrhL
VTGASADPIPAMGYQPGLDGLRAISVICVILYHAGFGWMRGGFFGVEVFFVVSGYLITSLLLEEHNRAGRVGLKQFWLRRARRLLPALFSVLIAVAVWARFAGSAEQRSTLRRDLPWSLLYLGNWGQIVGKTAYFSPVDPPLLRHLWSLAVEEQWYLLWPVVFALAFLIRGGGLRLRGAFFLTCSLLVMGLTFWLHGRGSSSSTISVFGRTADRTNFLYLGTLTRSSGLLLGAGSAFVWRPWRNNQRTPNSGRILDPVGAAAVIGVVCICSVAVLTQGYIYQWLLAVVSVLSMVAIAAAVHPDAVAIRRLLGWSPFVEVGKRSYGLYLWHWPIFVIGKVYHSGSWSKFLIAMAVTVVISELSYRAIEVPIRHGAIGRWFVALKTAPDHQRAQRLRLTVALGLTGAAGIGLLGSYYRGVQPFDPAAGGADVNFVLPVNPREPTASALTPVPAPSTAVATTIAGGPHTTSVATSVASTVAATTTTIAQLPRNVVVVGDSQAHALVINMPTGVDSFFTMTDGSVEGCGVLDSGDVVSEVRGFDRSLNDCVGWHERWGRSVQRSRAEVALVVLGAWDVFDIQLPDHRRIFGSVEADDHFLAQLQLGIDALKANGATVALLEIPCMRPVTSTGGGGVPALPERGDDTRTAHINGLLQRAAQIDPQHVFFIKGPTQWCADPAIGTDLAYRWDGVHYYKPGVNLVMQAISPALLQLPVTP